MYSLFIVILIALGSALGGGGVGWMVKDWKDGAKIAKLESRDAVVTAANAQCKTDVISVKAGVKDVTDALAAKKKAADAAMKDAEYWARKHSTLAQEVNSLPVRPDESTCDAIIREQIEYVQNRHTGN
ncbi:hypothetical protein [Nitrosospira briensis]|uniref:hypothetical protein n=1 Tax=Nitrosospira briensis TaxID=35799 RepID=UPI00046AB8E0|nr:hypothetical protein [Nitrosospira briensis]